MEQASKETLQFLFSFFIILIVIIFLAVAQFTFYYRRQKKIDLDLEKININHEKELLITKLEIQEETSHKISREIHDNIGLGLTLAKLQISNYIDSKKINDHLLDSSIFLISKSLLDLNDISKSLDGNQLASYGLINALESEVSVLKKSGIFHVDFDVVGETIYLDTETDLILLRIFQEACNNIIKHAKASKILIDMIYEQDWLHLKITDNGKGFNVEETTKNKEIRKMSGLRNFRTRAELIGAEVNITSIENIGTTIHIKTPIKNKI